jgi:hypothetical protein
MEVGQALAQALETSMHNGRRLGIDMHHVSVSQRIQRMHRKASPSHWHYTSIACISSHTTYPTYQSMLSASSVLSQLGREKQRGGRRGGSKKAAHVCDGAWMERMSRRIVSKSCSPLARITKAISSPLPCLPPTSPALHAPSLPPTSTSPLPSCNA